MPILIESGAAFGRTAAVTALTLALAACGSGVEVVQASGTSGGAGAGGGSSASSSSGGSGGAAVLPPPACSPGEGAIVAAAADVVGVVATFRQGAWVDAPSVIPGAASLGTFVTTDARLGVLWTFKAPQESFFALTTDGVHFDTKSVTGWAPDVWAWFVAVQPGLVMVGEQAKTVLASLDPGTLVWAPYLAPAPFAASSIAPLPGGELVAVGIEMQPGMQPELCSATTSAGAWGPVQCRPDAPAYTEGPEIAITPPIAVALPDGNVVVVYAEPLPSLAATTLHAGSWSAPDALVAAEPSRDFAAAATPGGDVIVASPGAAGMSAWRYEPGTGWGARIHLGDSGAVGGVVATGVCGDDALVAFRDGADVDEVRVARVRGASAESSIVANLGTQVYWMSIATMTPAVTP